MKRVLLGVLMVFGCFAASAQDGTIKGILSREDGQPAPFISVLVKETNIGTTTDTDGRFSIKVKPGLYTVLFSSVGYKVSQQKVVVEQGVITNVSVSLAEDTRQLNEIVISGNTSLNEQQLNIGKTSIKAFDLPQSVVAINSKVLNEQQTLRVSDVLKNVNGVYTMGTTGGTQEEIAGRGFAFGSNNTFKNGVRFNNGVMPEVSSLESVEILKGSNAILFGNVAAGGVMNLVTKKPKFENGGELSFRMGSYGMYKPSVDVYGAVGNSNTVAYRLNASYEKSQSFRDVVNAERVYINPSFLVNLGKKTSLLIEADYLNDNRTPDYGIGAINYVIADVPRSRFLGTSWQNYEVTQKSLTLTGRHQFNSNWDLRVTGGAQGFESDLFSTARPTTVRPDGTWNRNLQRTAADETYLLGQVDLSGNFATGSIKHTLLVGGDIDRYSTKSYGYKIYALQQYPDSVSTAYDKINVFDLSAFEQRMDIPKALRSTLTETPITRVGFYVQDFVTISDKLKVLAGLRYSYMETRSNASTYNASAQAVPNATQTPARFDDAFTPRFGIVYQPLKTTSVFASYANSFNLNTGRDINFNPLRPSMMDQYEVGVKNELLNGLLSANITAYQIVNSNLSQSVFPAPVSPLNPSAQELAGEVTSKGIELDLMTRSIKGFSFIAGYSYNDTRYTESNIYVVGSRLRYNPVHTANFSTQYAVPATSVLKGLNAGFTLFYVGDMMAGRSTRLTVPDDAFKLIPLPSFFQGDVSLGYSYSNASIRLRMTNVTNVLGFYAHDDNSINPIAPRQFVTTLAYKF
jgi:iron complex outermembrane recepter protein